MDYSKAISFYQDYTSAYLGRANAKAKRDIFNKSTKYNEEIAIDSGMEIITNQSDYFEWKKMADPDLYTISTEPRDLSKELNSLADNEGKIYSLALTKLEIGDFFGALNYLDNYIENTDSDCDAYFQRGLIRSKVDNINGAINDFDKAIELADNYPLSYYFRGIEKYRSGDSQGACEDWNIAKKIGGNSQNKFLNKFCKKM